MAGRRRLHISRRPRLRLCRRCAARPTAPGGHPRSRHPCRPGGPRPPPRIGGRHHDAGDPRIPDAAGAARSSPSPTSSRECTAAPMPTTSASSVTTPGAHSPARSASSACSPRPPIRARSAPSPISAGRRRRSSPVPASTRRAIRASRCGTCSRPIRATTCSRSTRISCSTSPCRSWRSTNGRASGCSPAATGSTASSRSSSSCRATVTTATSGSRIGDYLARVFDGHVSAFYPAFPEGALTRVHFIIGRAGGETPNPDQATLEAVVEEIVTDWEDDLAAAIRRAFDADTADRLIPVWRDGVPGRVSRVDAAGCRGRRHPRHRGLTEERPIAGVFHRDEGDAAPTVLLKLIHLGGPIALSKRVPMLEDTGASRHRRADL